VEEMPSSESKKKHNISKKIKDRSEDSENPDYSNEYNDDGNDTINPPEDFLDDQEILEPKVIPSGQRG
jgi:hypothetical protein